MLVGISGKIASGKTTTAKIIENILGEDKVFRTSLSEILKDVLYDKADYTDIRLDWPNKDWERENLIAFGRELKNRFGKDVLIKLALQKGKYYGKSHIIIDGIRTVPEAKAIKDNNGVLLYIDACDNIRYKYFKIRNAEKDKKINTFEKFLEATFNEDVEYAIYKLQAMADHIILNMGDLEELTANVLKVLNTIKSGKVKDMLVK